MFNTDHLLICLHYKVFLCGDEAFAFQELKLKNKSDSWRCVQRGIVENNRYSI